VRFLRHCINEYEKVRTGNETEDEHVILERICELFKQVKDWYEDRKKLGQNDEIKVLLDVN